MAEIAAEEEGDTLEITVNATRSNDTELEWGNVSSQGMLLAIVKLGASMKPVLVGENTKKLPAVYVTWDKLSDMQKNKTMEWWRKCTVAGKAALNSFALAQASEKAVTEKEKATKTMKNDLAMTQS